MNKWKKAAALTLCLCFLSCTAVQAAESASGNIDYSAVFDAEYYYNTYQDVQQTIGFNEEDLLDHFIRSGMAEGRMGKADFDVRSYMKNNLDLLAVYGIKDLSAYYYHYIQSGKAEGRTVGYPSRNADEIASFSTQYNTEEDRATNVELAAQRIDGIVIQPGTSFSFSNSIMSRTTENGYVVAPSFCLRQSRFQRRRRHLPGILHLIRGYDALLHSCYGKVCPFPGSGLRSKRIGLSHCRRCKGSAF